MSDGAAQELIPAVYRELKAVAARYMQGERSDHTLQATALVHEAYIRLAEIKRMDWKGRSHFFAVAATQMRRVLIDHARAARADKRPGRRHRTTLTEATALAPEQSIDVLALDESLNRLADRDPRQARVAEMRLFAGMLVAEVAQVLDVSERTVKRDWLVARAWLADALKPGGTGSTGS